MNEIPLDRLRRWLTGPRSVVYVYGPEPPNLKADVTEIIADFETLTDDFMKLVQEKERYKAAFERRGDLVEMFRSDPRFHLVQEELDNPFGKGGE